MRHVVLDTETTGLNASKGDRIIEIACIEMIARRPTGAQFHYYLNPERAIDAGAQAVHGISDEFLQDKLKFREISAEFLEFIRGSDLVIHNAVFDISFLNSELSRLDLPPIDEICHDVIDTLKLAKELHPGQRNSLDALCQRYDINNAQRTIHGALLDASLLTEVYLALTRGQESLLIDLAIPAPAPTPIADSRRRPLMIFSANEEELMQHQQSLEQINKESKDQCLWLKIQQKEARHDA